MGAMEDRHVGYDACHAVVRDTGVVRDVTRLKYVIMHPIRRVAGTELNNNLCCGYLIPLTLK